MAKEYDLLRSNDGVPTFKPGMTDSEKLDLVLDYILRIKDQCGAEIDLIKRRQTE